MGKGDKKTKRGKIVNGSYGRLRRKESKKTKYVKPIVAEVSKKIKAGTTEPVEEKTTTKKATTKKTPVKKASAAKADKKEVKKTTTKKTVAKKTTAKKTTAKKAAAKPKKED